MIFVATARWCEEHWVIAAGHDRDAVVRDAEIRVAFPRSDHVIAEDYIVEEVEESVSAADLTASSRMTSRPPTESGELPALASPDEVEAPAQRVPWCPPPAP